MTGLTLAAQVVSPQRDSNAIRLKPDASVTFTRQNVNPATTAYFNSEHQQLQVAAHFHGLSVKKASLRRGSWFIYRQNSCFVYPTIEAEVCSQCRMFRVTSCGIKAWRSFAKPFSLDETPPVEHSSAGDFRYS